MPAPIMPTIAIAQIAKRWRDAIATDTDIEAFCQTKYGRSIKAMLGFDSFDKPTDEDCPYATVVPLKKNEGLCNDKYTYVLAIGWAIVNDTVDRVGNKVTFPGVEEVEELGRLIFNAVAALNPEFPVEDSDFDIESMAWFPQHVGRMDLTLSYTVPMGVRGLIIY